MPTSRRKTRRKEPKAVKAWAVVRQGAIVTIGTDEKGIRWFARQRLKGSPMEAVVPVMISPILNRKVKR